MKLPRLLDQYILNTVHNFPIENSYIRLLEIPVFDILKVSDSHTPLCVTEILIIPPPSILGWSSVKNNTIDLYTGNYLYPLLNNQPLPLGKTFLGSFELSSGESVIADQTAYLRYFGEGVLNAYKFSTNKQVAFSEDLRDSLSDAFLEWYGSWANLDNFKLYRHFYFPIDREYPDWVTILQIVKEAYPHPSSVQLGENWEDSCETLAFTSIDFIESSGKVALYMVNPEIWSSMYTEEQAIFRYYDIEKGTIHFWTPRDLILDHEIRVIAGLINKKPEEVLAVFSNWLSGTGPYNNLYFNYVGESSFDWINDPVVRYSLCVLKDTISGKFLCFF